MGDLWFTVYLRTRLTVYQKKNAAAQYSLVCGTFFCMILFAVFVFMQNEGKDILHVSSAKVVQEVSKNADITDVWKKLP